MSKERPIAWEPHPVSTERKRELIAGGFRIIDIIFQLEEDKPVPEPKAQTKRKYTKAE